MADSTQSASPWITPDEARLAIDAGDGTGVRIAVLDSGIDHAHPQLASLTVEDDIAILSRGGQITVEESTEGDVFGHGTGVAPRWQFS